MDLSREGAMSSGKTKSIKYERLFSNDSDVLHRDMHSQGAYAKNEEEANSACHNMALSVVLSRVSIKGLN